MLAHDALLITSHKRTSVFPLPVHVRKQRAAGELGHGPDDLPALAVQGGGSDHHVPLQEQRGLQGRGGEPEEGHHPEGSQRPGPPRRGEQPLQIHRHGGQLLRKRRTGLQHTLLSTQLAQCPEHGSV